MKKSAREILNEGAKPRSAREILAEGEAAPTPVTSPAPEAPTLVDQVVGGIDRFGDFLMGRPNTRKPDGFVQNVDPTLPVEGQIPGSSTYMPPEFVQSSLDAHNAKQKEDALNLVAGAIGRSGIGSFTDELAGLKAAVINAGPVAQGQAYRRGEVLPGFGDAYTQERDSIRREMETAGKLQPKVAGIEVLPTALDAVATAPLAAGGALKTMLGMGYQGAAAGLGQSVDEGFIGKLRDTAIGAGTGLAAGAAAGLASWIPRKIAAGSENALRHVVSTQAAKDTAELVSEGARAAGVSSGEFAASGGAAALAPRAAEKTAEYFARPVLPELGQRFGEFLKRGAGTGVVGAVGNAAYQQANGENPDLLRDLGHGFGMGMGVASLGQVGGSQNFMQTMGQSPLVKATALEGINTLANGATRAITSAAGGAATLGRGKFQAEDQKLRDQEKQERDDLAIQGFTANN